MSEFQYIGAYAGLILLVSMLGGYLPFLGQVTHARMQLYLSASAGVMLGASFFHVMPEAVSLAGNGFGWWMSLGVVGLFCIERFLAPHSHEMDGPGHKHVGEDDCDPSRLHTHQPHVHDHSHDHGHSHDHSHDHGHEHCDHGHDPVGKAPAPGSRSTPAAPAVAGWMAVLGLTIHTFMNGVGLAGAVQAEHDRSVLAAEAAHHHDHAGHDHAGHDHAGHGHDAHHDHEHEHDHDAHHGHDHGTSERGVRGWLGSLAIPGLALFLAIALHKPADALAVSMMLSRKGVSRTRVMLTQVGFAAMVPLGAVAFYITQGQIESYWAHGDPDMAHDVQRQITGAALAFSAGTFLFIALSDLLPEVQFHRHDRVKLFLALLAGVALMGFIALLEGHDHGAGDAHDHGHSHAKPAAVKPAADKAAADDCCAECKDEKAANTPAKPDAAKADPAKAKADPKK